MSLPIGFFSPLPLPIMVPFMFMQSAAMALGFGSFFQYGKRKVSAMSNEEFNALTPEALTAQLMSSVNNMIPTVEQSFKQMEQMNVLILEAMAKYFDQAVQFLGQWITGRGESLVHTITEHGEDFLPDTSGVTDLFKFGGEDIPSFIPTAGGSTTEDLSSSLTIDKGPKFTPNEEYVARWVTWSKTGWTTLNWSGITFKEISFVLKLYAEKKLPKATKALGQSILKKYNELKPKKLTPEAKKEKTFTAIDTTATAEVARIAKLFAVIQFWMDKYTSPSASSTGKNLAIKKFFAAAKKYNQYVQSIGKAKLSIDTAKSILQLKIVPK